MMSGLLKLFGFGGGRSKVEKIDAREAHTRAQKKQLMLVDVRSPAEWRETGLPANARKLTLQGPPAFTAELSTLTGGDLNQPIGFICRSGSRSGMAAAYAKRAGYTAVFNVRGGMQGAGGWLASRLPLNKA